MKNFTLLLKIDSPSLLEKLTNLSWDTKQFNFELVTYNKADDLDKKFDGILTDSKKSELDFLKNLIKKSLTPALFFLNSELRDESIGTYLPESLIGTGEIPFMVSGAIRNQNKINKLKDEKLVLLNYMSRIVHDLRGPLGNIQNYIEILTDEEGFDMDPQEFYKTIDEAAKKVIRQINEELTLVKLERDGLVFENTAFNLNDLLNSIFSEYKPLFDEKKIQLILNLGSEAKVNLDSDKLTTVLNHLLENSLKFTKAEGFQQFTKNLCKSIYQVVITIFLMVTSQNHKVFRLG